MAFLIPLGAKSCYCIADQRLCFRICKGHLCLRCKKSLNLRFGRTKFSFYDYGAEFGIYRRRNIYTFVYKTVWLIKQNPDNAAKYFHNPPHLWQKWTIRFWIDMHSLSTAFFKQTNMGLFVMWMLNNIHSLIVFCYVILSSFWKKC